MWLKALVVDADPQIRMLLSDMLVKGGWEVFSGFGKEKLEKLKVLEPDLILVDFQMSGADGVEVLSRIRQAAGTRKVKIIALTSLSGNDEMRKIIKTGFDGYLLKPIDIGKFHELIGEFSPDGKNLGNKLKILCVDDDPQNLKLLEAILETAGYKFLGAQGGLEAFSTLKHEEVDLILLDVMMPDIDGYEICRRIKASAETVRVPVIMITSLSSREDRIKSIEAGAEDFITKPFETIEVLTRIRKLLEMREKSDKIASLFGMLSELAEEGSRSAEKVSNSGFDILTEMNALIRGITAGRNHGPHGMLFGTIKMGWINYDFTDSTAVKPENKISTEKLSFLLEGPVRILYVNNGQYSSSESEKASQALAQEGLNFGNFICRAGGGLCLVSYNFQKSVTDQDAVVLKALAMQIQFMLSVAAEIKETENAFDYIVFTLARVAEANDEDTGMHILRVGEYAGLLAEKMGMETGFVERIKRQAQLHDVGKIHIPKEILTKPGPLTAEEFGAMTLHTVYGAEIIGQHERLSMARKIAISHHERWDGTGYPRGLKGEEIPLEARITAVADQYDALRNARSYKAAFSHEKTFDIIMKGDGRTKPEHFDPAILAVFFTHATEMEEIYDKLCERESQKQKKTELKPENSPV